MERYLADLVATAREVLGDDLVGAYGAGSLALAAYDPGRSDVDIALLTAGPLSLERKRALVARLRHEALPCPARGLELVAYRRDVAASGTAEPGFEVELNSGSTMDFRATYDPADRPVEDGLFWYGLDRSILHQSGRTLLGPPAPTVFADLAPVDLRRLLVDALDWWLDRPTAADDAVLGACRSLVRIRDGRWLSKADAGQRLIEGGDPAAALIRQALTARDGGPAPSGPAARDFQRRVRAEVAAGA